MAGRAFRNLTEVRGCCMTGLVLVRSWPRAAGIAAAAGVFQLLKTAGAKTLRARLLLATVTFGLATAGTAWGACLPNSIRMQIVVHKYDGPTSIIDAAKTPDAQFDSAFQSITFRRFVEEVTSRLSAELDERGLCDAAKGTPFMAARFVYIPYVAKSFTPDAPVDDITNSGQCRIFSPWLRLTYDPKATPPIRATFIWNERQVLFDQAVLSGAPADPLRLEPLNVQTYLDLTWMYQEEEMKVPDAERKPLDGRIPADTLWLFRGAWQSTLIPFGINVIKAVEAALEQAAPRQALLAASLTQMCLDARGEHHVFNTIQDTASVITLDAYRIRSILGR